MKQSFLFFLSFLFFAVMATTSTINSSEAVGFNFNLTEGNCIFDNATNITFCADLFRLNVAKELNLGENYTDELRNITIKTVDPFLNINLTYGGCYLETDPTIKALCMQIPSKAAVLNFTFRNITVNAPAFPMLNLNQLLNYGQNVSYADYNLSLASRLQTGQASLVVVNRSVDAGDSFSLADRNITVNCRVPSPDYIKLNLIKYLSKSEPNYRNNQINFTVYGNFTDTIVNVSYCNQTNGTQVIDYSHPWCYELERNAGCNNTILVSNKGTQYPVCLDTIDQFCAYEEIKSGDFASCLRRYISQQQSIVNQTLEQFSTCQKEVTAWQVGMNVSKEYRAERNDFLTLFFGAVALFAFAVTIWYYLDKRQKVINMKRYTTEPNYEADKELKEIKDQMHKMLDDSKKA